MDSQWKMPDPRLSLKDIYGDALIDIEPSSATDQQHFIKRPSTMKANLTTLYAWHADANGRLNDLGKQVYFAGVDKLFPSPKMLWDLRKWLAAGDVYELDGNKRDEILRDVTFMEQRVHVLLPPHNPNPTNKRRRIDQSDGCGSVRPAPPPTPVEGSAGTLVEDTSTTAEPDRQQETAPASDSGTNQLDPPKRSLKEVHGDDFIESNLRVWGEPSIIREIANWRTKIEVLFDVLSDELDYLTDFGTEMYMTGVWDGSLPGNDDMHWVCLALHYDMLGELKDSRDIAAQVLSDYTYLGQRLERCDECVRLRDQKTSANNSSSSITTSDNTAATAG